MKQFNDLEKITLELWKEKKIIFFFIFLCLFLTYYFYIKKIDRYYKSEIVISKPAFEILPEYNYLLSRPKINVTSLPNAKNATLNEIFFSTYIQTLLSSNNFQDFIDNSDDQAEIKSYIKKNKLNLNRYLKEKIGFSKDNDKLLNRDYDNILNFYLIYHETWSGDVFINNYAQYTANKVFSDTKASLKELIINDILHYENELKISRETKKINEHIQLLSLTNIANEKFTISLLGEEIISNQIKSLNVLLKNLENKKINYNPVFNKSTSKEEISRNIGIYYLFSIIFAFIFSLVFINLKIFFKKIRFSKS
jgi:hypothetical protein